MTRVLVRKKGDGGGQKEWESLIRSRMGEQKKGE
jgi:hypothetical protein